MPSHPDRVRRNYHEITVREDHDSLWDDKSITIRVTRLQIASAMTATEIYHNILRAIRNGIFGNFPSA